MTSVIDFYGVLERRGAGKATVLSAYRHVGNQCDARPHHLRLPIIVNNQRSRDRFTIARAPDAMTAARRMRRRWRGCIRIPLFTLTLAVRNWISVTLIYRMLNNPTHALRLDSLRVADPRGSP